MQDSCRKVVAAGREVVMTYFGASGAGHSGADE